MYIIIYIFYYKYVDCRLQYFDCLPPKQSELEFHLDLKMSSASVRIFFGLTLKNQLNENNEKKVPDRAGLAVEEKEINGRSLHFTKKEKDKKINEGKMK